MSEWQSALLALDYMPHGYCYLWDTGLVRLHVISDAVIAISYYVIPIILFYFVRKRRDLPFNWMFVMFAVFILSCGTTHLMDVWTLWHADYWLSGWIKAVTAAASAAAAALLLPLAPKALALPSPSQLAAANEKLQDEIAERMRVEEALEEKNRELEAANRAKDRFLASMSHELRTPLNAIIGFTGILLMGLPGKLNEEQRKQLQSVRLSAKHLLSLINDLLDLAKIESGEVTLIPAPVVCQQVVEQVCGTLEPLAQAKGLTLQTTASERGLTAITDRRSLSRILMNLGGNAIKFTEKGGVRIALEERQRDGTKWVEIRVHDTGIGITPENQQRLFEDFGWAGVVDSASREAPGLGLHLSRKLAELLGGSISLKSDPGKGSTFTLMLPVEAPEPSS